MSAIPLPAITAPGAPFTDAPLPASPLSALPITTLTSRQFNQEVSRAKRAADEGPVFITDRGRPAHVLMSYAHYQMLSGGTRNMVDMLGMASDTEIGFEPPHLNIAMDAADLT